MARPEKFPIKKLIGFDQELLDALEAYRRDQQSIPTVSDAIREILRRYLEEKGYSRSAGNGDE